MATPRHPHQPDERGPQRPDDDLRHALRDAAGSVTPADRLGELRRRTARPERRSRWMPIVLGAGAATAAVVAAGVVVGGGFTGPLPGGTPAADGPRSATTATGSPAAERNVATYYLGDSPTGTRLYREFAFVTDGSGSDAVLHALERLTDDTGPTDPDYRTVWPAGSFRDALVTDDAIVVDVDPVALARPAGLSAGEAALGLQQVVYTAEAAVGRALPVRFEQDGADVEELLGLPTVGPVARDTDYATTAPVNISDPGEGVEAEATLVARGSAADTLRTVRWTLTDGSGRPVAAGRAAVRGDGDAVTPYAPGWETEPIDLTALAAGSYVFTVRASSIGQTSDAPAVFTDDRTVIVP